MSLLSLLRKDERLPEYRKKGVIRVYEYQGRYLVCPVRGIGEDDRLTELPVTIEDAVLGEAAMRHLMEYDPHDSRDPQRPQREWEAYCVSGARSIKAFERELWHVDVGIENGYIEIRARPRLSLHDQVSVRTAMMIPRDLAELGASIRRTIAGAKALREAGVV